MPQDIDDAETADNDDDPLAWIASFEWATGLLGGNVDGGKSPERCFGLSVKTRHVEDVNIFTLNANTVEHGTPQPIATTNSASTMLDLIKSVISANSGRSDGKLPGTFTAYANRARTEKHEIEPPYKAAIARIHSLPTGGFVLTLEKDRRRVASISGKLSTAGLRTMSAEAKKITDRYGW